MSTAGASLHGFAYGEQLDGVPPRSLGYGLLAPAAPASWTAEVEALARWLHGTPYPDPWPVVELFCSVLLADGQRVIAVARYGLADHTASRRRGGLELVGVVAPGNLSAASALAVYRWLRDLRSRTEDLAALGREHPLADVLTAAPPAPLSEPPPVVPIRVWQDGVFLFAATSPQDPDNRLGLLTHETGTWQWLPLCGVDFPLQTYARRGPLVAWTPHLADVAVKLDRKPTEEPVPAPRRPLALGLTLAALLLLFSGNLWALLTLPSRIAAERPVVVERPQKAAEQPSPRIESDRAVSREKFALALSRLLTAEKRPGAEVHRPQRQLVEQYRRLLKDDPDLLVDDARGQAAVGLVSLLARWSPEKVARVVQEELGDQELMKWIGERLRARLLAEKVSP